MLYYRSRRMSKQQERNNNDPTQYVTFINLAPDYSLLRGIIIGRKGTAYEDEIIEINITVPYQYPLKPIQCRTAYQLFHPNITQKGQICHIILTADWSAAFQIIKVLQIIMDLLQEPLQEFCNIQAGRLYSNDKQAYQNQVKKALQAKKRLVE